jgi:organic hydroperoxide reductase OsmC/OhrA
MTTFVAIAENSKLNFRSFDCRATGVLEQVAGKLIMTEIQLEPAVLITNGKDHDLTLRILRETKKNCLICNSIKTKITMHPWIEVLQLSVDKNNLLVQ